MEGHFFTEFVFCFTVYLDNVEMYWHSHSMPWQLVTAKKISCVQIFETNQSLFHQFDPCFGVTKDRYLVTLSVDLTDWTLALGVL